MLTNDGEIFGCHQRQGEDDWFPGWYSWTPTPQNSQFIELTAARLHNNHVALWGLDTNFQLWCMSEKAPDGNTPPSDWGPWEGPNWQGAPKLRNITAVRGHEGAILWGIDENYRMTNNWQDRTGKWNGWSPLNWLGAPHCYALTAAGQNNDCVQLSVVTVKGNLSSIAQVAPTCKYQQQWSDRDE